MPIILTTAFDPGALDPDNDYSEVKIISQSWNENLIDITCEYGNTVSGVWESGIRVRQGPVTNPTKHRLTDIPEGDQHYTDAVTAMPVSGVSIYGNVKDYLYQWLLDEEVYDGTIV